MLSIFSPFNMWCIRMTKTAWTYLNVLVILDRCWQSILCLKVSTALNLIGRFGIVRFCFHHRHGRNHPSSQQTPDYKKMTQEKCNLRPYWACLRMVHRFTTCSTQARSCTFKEIARNDLWIHLTLVTFCPAVDCGRKTMCSLNVVEVTDGHLGR